MKVIIAEKPSVARELAQFLNIKQKSSHDFHDTRNETFITWTYGHLLELVEPNSYDPKWKKWSLDILPIIPDEFKLQVIKRKGIPEQLSHILKLLQTADEIIAATDAGREGELIFRNILKYSNVNLKNKKVKRLWISSLTHDSISHGFSNLLDIEQTKGLFHAASARSYADWLVGINGTRAMTCLYGDGDQLFTLGRVQTPTLALVVQRDYERKHFKPENYYLLQTEYKKVIFKHFTKFSDKEKDQVNTLCEDLKSKAFSISKIKQQDEKEFSPLPFDLTSLQKDANRLFNLTAKQTLDIAQQLYEKKFITYPRTDSRYLSEDIKKTAISYYHQVVKSFPEYEKMLNQPLIHNKYYKDEKVTDHHAIIPTKNPPQINKLSQIQNSIYDLILRRFLSLFYPPCIKSSTKIDAFVEKTLFKTSGVLIKESGYLILYPHLLKNEKNLPPFVQGESGEHLPKVTDHKTIAPLEHTDSSILHLMETAGRLVDEKDLSMALKDKGLGTPATRAAIIENLINRNYLQREGKKIISTQSGQKLIFLLQDPTLKSAELTGSWEQKLKQMENNDYLLDTFLDEIKDFSKKLPQVLNNQIKNNVISLQPPCVKCKGHMIMGKTMYGCSNWKNGCEFRIPFYFDQTNLDLNIINELCVLGKTLKQYPLSNNRWGYIILDLNSHSNLVAQYIDSHPHDFMHCLLCNKKILENKKAFYCEGYKSGCSFTLWKTFAGKKLSENQIKKILKDKDSGIIKGFKSKQGKKFNAKIVWKEKKFQFSFPSNDKVKSAS